MHRHTVSVRQIIHLDLHALVILALLLPNLDKRIPVPVYSVMGTWC